MSRVAVERPGDRARRWTIAFYVVLTLYLGYLLWRTAHLPLFEWDESRNVLHAYEMLRRGDWIAATYGGSLDPQYYKPPFVEWLLALSFEPFGYSELAARLPSVLFGLGCGALVFHFLERLGVRPWLAAASGFALVTVKGFYGFHALTSADVDATACFFNTASFAAIYLIFFEDRPRWCWALGLTLGLGFMTKSVVGLMPAAGGALAWAWNRERAAARAPQLAGGLLVAVLTVLPWLIARVLLYPDHYLRKLFGHDALARFATVLDGHVEGSWFYLGRAAVDLGPWLFVGVGAALVLLRAPLVAKARGAPRRVGVRPRAAAYAGFMIAFYFLAFTVAKTKFPWYVLPAYPLFFVLTGLGLEELAEKRAGKWLAVGVAGLLALNAWEIRSYEAGRWTKVVLVDYVLFPFKPLLWGKPIIVQGDVAQNAYVSARVYSDLSETIFPQRGVSLDRMLETAPAAEFLASTEAQRYARDPRLRAVVLVTVPGRADKCGLFRILSPSPPSVPPTRAGGPAISHITQEGG